MKISPVGLALIKREERFMPRMYKCIAGRLTIGYGHVLQPGEERYKIGAITEAAASALLQADVDREYGAHVARRLLRDVTQNQFDAMVSLCYNIGVGGFDKSSVLALANAGTTAPDVIRRAFGLWNKYTDPKTGQRLVSAGLTARRGREAALYLS